MTAPPREVKWSTIGYIYIYTYINIYMTCYDSAAARGEVVHHRRAEPGGLVAIQKSSLRTIRLKRKGHRKGDT